MFIRSLVVVPFYDGKEELNTSGILVPTLVAVVFLERDEESAREGQRRRGLKGPLSTTRTENCELRRRRRIEGIKVCFTTNLLSVAGWWCGGDALEQFRFVH